MQFNCKPILFNTAMVQAILKGRKTQTRRIAKEIKWYAPYFDVVDEVPMACDINGDWYPAERFSRIQPGNILWVRETWKQATTGTAGPGLIDLFLYKADEPQDTTGMMVEDRWHPAIHMPYNAARIFLRIDNVRIERLQDISEDDVCMEGAEQLISGCEHMDWSVVPPEPCFNTNQCPDCIISYSYPELFGKKVWDPFISKDKLSQYGWDANPWVWVYEFTRVDKESIYK